MGGTPSPHLALLRVGFAKPPGSPRTLVRSYRTVSPLPNRSPAVCFLWHFPADHSDWLLASTLPCGAPTFLDPIMSGRGHPADSPLRPYLTSPGDQVPSDAQRASGGASVRPVVPACVRWCQRASGGASVRPGVPACVRGCQRASGGTRLTGSSVLVMLGDVADTWCELGQELVDHFARSLDFS